ncbi:hypothetical protein R4Z10_18975 [Niallia sp. XMNu-256]|uniref:hypothetical protein n=1 Tax=Niallia sp. XMNu-256 TaxID=3082444 RepID=UPI0030CC8E94
MKHGDGSAVSLAWLQGTTAGDTAVDHWRSDSDDPNDRGVPHFLGAFFYLNYLKTENIKQV